MLEVRVLLVALFWVLWKTFLAGWGLLGYKEGLKGGRV